MVAGVVARCRICEYQTAEPDVFSQHVADQHPGESALALALFERSESSSDAMRLSLRLERARNQINAIAQDMRDTPLSRAGGLVPYWARRLQTIVEEARLVSDPHRGEVSDLCTRCGHVIHVLRLRTNEGRPTRICSFCEHEYGPVLDIHGEAKS